MEIGDTVTLDAITPPAGVTLLDDPETVVATLTPPRLQLEEEPEIEEETELVGRGRGRPRRPRREAAEERRRRRSRRTSGRVAAPECASGRTRPSTG